MKTNILQTIIAAALAFFAATSFASGSSLNLRTYNNSLFTVVFDGQAYTQPTNNLRLEQIVAGHHNIQVLSAVPSLFSFYTVMNNSIITINQNAEVYAVLDQYGVLNVSQTIVVQPAFSYGGGYHPGCQQVNTNLGALNGTNTYNYGYNNGYNYNYGQNNSYGLGNNCGNTTQLWGPPTYNNNMNNYGGGYTYYGMNPNDFMALKQTIISRTFDSSKRDAIKFALNTNKFTSEQVRDLMNLLDFESSKMEIAKLAYASTIDQQNYYEVYDAFDFESSIAELNSALGIG